MKTFLLASILQVFVLTTLLAHAASGQHLDKRIKVVLSDNSVKESLLSIEKQSAVKFVIPEKLMTATSKTVSMNNNNIAVKDAIDLVLQSTNLRYKIVDGYVVIEEKATLQQNTGSIRGRVVDSADASPLPSANIRIQEANRGASTDQYGNFILMNVPAGTYTLQVSFIGMDTKTQRVTVQRGQQAEMVFRLSSGNVLQEVEVVTALGIKREERALGYSITSVKGEQLTEAMSSNWTDALSGKVAGLNLVRSNAGPVGTNKIILRGENNLTGDNEALIVVDGIIINSGSGRRTAISGEDVYGTGSDNMPVDYGSGINDINPEDIESVSVLKGPGAAALYGQDAANGAIIITTKTGNRNRKGLGITVNSNSSIEQINRWPDLQFEYGQGTGGRNYYSFGASEDGASTSATSSAYGPRFDGQMFYQFDPVTMARGTERTPWVAYPNKLRNFFDVAQTHTNSVSIDGGGERTTARFSLTNVANNWIVPNTGYGRTSLALSVNSKTSEKLTINTKMTYNNRYSDNMTGAGYGNQSLMYWFIFWQPSADMDWLKNYWHIRDADNRPIPPGRRIMFPFSSFPENPYAIAYEFINQQNRHAFTGNVQATYDFTKTLSLQLRAGTDFSYEKRAQERPYDAGSKFQFGSYRTQSIFSQELNADFMLRYKKDINEDIEISASAGGATRKNYYNKDEVRADSLVYPGLYTMANNRGPLVTLPNRSQYVLNSFYGLVTTSYKNFLYLDVTGRQDWNSVLATPLRTDGAGFFYGSANLSLILSDLFSLPSAINFAKLRSSFAGVGSGSNRAYRTSFNYSSAGSLYNGGLENPGTLANPNLNPLSTRTWELGTDLKFFRSRLNLDAAVYFGTTKDQILERIVDRSSGYTRAIVNLGAVRNSGLEIALEGRPLVSKDKLTWTVNMNYAFNKNRITALGDSSVVLRYGPIGGGQVVAMVGGSMGDIYGRGYVRSPDGQIVYDARTGYARITDEVLLIGNTIPLGKVGINNVFGYRQFRVSALFDAQWGAKAHSHSHHKLAEQGKTTNTLPGRYNGITGNGVIQNPDGSYSPNTTIATDIDQYYRSHWGIDNAEGNVFSTDFIKFREARIDYTFKPSFINRIGLQRATLGVYGRDLFIWSPWPNFDPEFGTLSGTDVQQGFEVGQFPSTRTFGINLILGL